MAHELFISYRRDDASAEAINIKSVVCSHFGDGSAFLDTSSIRAGTRWADTIKAELDAASTVIAVVGPSWLTAGQNEWGQRRIDDPDDWVRQELATSYSSNKRVLPVLVRGAKVPPQNALPDPLKPLAAEQAIEIRRDYWEHDVQLLVAQLDDRRADPSEGGQWTWPYPRRFPEGPAPVPLEKVRSTIAAELGNWTLETSKLPEKADLKREELCREFKFNTFQEAIGFMNQVAPGCDIAGHHPRWENIWKTLRVFLTTWDIQRRISDRDIQLARYFERAYSEFPGAAHEEPERKSKPTTGGV